MLPMNGLYIIFNIAVKFKLMLLLLFVFLLEKIIIYKQKLKYKKKYILLFTVHFFQNC